MTTLTELTGYATQVNYSYQLPKSARYYKSDFILTDNEYIVIDIFISLRKNSQKYFFRIVPAYNENDNKPQF